MTVHDSPDSDCSSNSPYTVESRPPNNNSYDTKTTILDNYNNGNPRTIIIPPLKTQNSEVPSECERLMPGEELWQAEMQAQTSACMFPGIMPGHQWQIWIGSQLTYLVK